VVPPVLGAMPRFGVIFLSYEFIKRQIEEEGKPLHLYQICFAGFMSGFGTTPLTAPVERVKTILQISRGRTYVSNIECAKALIKVAILLFLFTAHGIVLIARWII